MAFLFTMLTVVLPTIGAATVAGAIGYGAATGVGAIVDACSE